MLVPCAWLIRLPSIRLKKYELLWCETMQFYDIIIDLISEDDTKPLTTFGHMCGYGRRATARAPADLPQR